MDLDRVREELGKIYQQLITNSYKTCGKESLHLREELLHFCIQEFLDKPLEYQVKVINDGKLENMITRMMGLNLKSSTSPFYYKIRKYTNNSRELLSFYDYQMDDSVSEETEASCLCISGSVSELPYYEKYLIEEHYYKGSKLSDISKKTKISPNVVRRDIMKTLKKIKNKCQQHYFQKL